MALYAPFCDMSQKKSSRAALALMLGMTFRKDVLRSMKDVSDKFIKG